jgi:class 3 adenylate cyclase
MVVEGKPMDATRSLPTGTVTLLFTNLEGSTRLWEQEPEAMRQTLAHHDALLRVAIESRRGRVFKTMGDAFCAVFADASDAVHAAVEGQSTLYKHLPQVRVRMLHGRSGTMAARA